MKKTLVKGLGLLIAAAVLAVPMVAQQEVDPDHFDGSARPAQNQKPAAGHKLSRTHSKTTVHQASSSAKSNAQRGSRAATKTEPVTVAADTKSR